MVLHQVWVHGTSVRSEWVGDNLLRVRGDRWDLSSGEIGWSDINGLPRGWGATFRGKRSVTTGIGSSTTVGPFDPANPFEFSQKGYWFHFALPTPVIVSNQQARLLRVFVLWTSSREVDPIAIHVYDGVNRIASLPFTFGAQGLTGEGGLADLQDGVTKFDLASPHGVLWSIGISVGVSFKKEGGEITFISAGADFEV